MNFKSPEHFVYSNSWTYCAVSRRGGEHVYRDEFQIRFRVEIQKYVSRSRRAIFRFKPPIAYFQASNRSFYNGNDNFITPHWKPNEDWAFH